jgi:VWFA-related protein
MRWTFLLAVGLGLSAPGAVDQSDPAAVQLDVSVTDPRGGGVPALTSGDFTVSEAGTPVLIDAVRFVDQPATPSTVDAPAVLTADDERRAAAQPGARIFAFFLDEYHVSDDAAPGLRDALGAFISNETRPTDLLLVLKPLEPLLSLRLTRNRDAVLGQVAAFSGRRDNLEAKTPLERDLVAGDPARIHAVRAQVALSALQGLCAFLGRFPDVRKTVVVASEGFDMPSARRVGMLPTADSLIRTANRATVTVSQLDPRLGRAATADATPAPEADVVHRLVAETAGDSIGPPFADGLKRVASSMAGYYVLTFRGAVDGRFHPLTVQVKTPGAKVRTRRGYWAASGDELVRVTMVPETPAPLPPALRTSAMIRPWVGQSRGTDGRTRVLFVWEPAGRVPGSRDRSLPPSRVVVTATTAAGTQVFEGKIVAASRAMEGGPPARAEFEVPAGRVRLQSSVEDAAGGVLDTDVREVVVGALSGPVAIGTPAVYRARTVLEQRALAANAEAAPTSARVFSRAEYLLIRWPVYSAGGNPTIEATLLGRSGRILRTLPVVPGAESVLYTLDLPLSGLAAGDYILQVKASSGTADARETVAFRVTP